MRRLIAVLVSLLALAGVTDALAAGTRSVKVGDNWFVRPGAAPTITVAKGTRVTWRWTGENLHDVAVVSGPTTFTSDFQTEGTFSKTLRRRGTYVLRCDVHRKKMRMKVVVK
jgi:plastocyanin